jgi:polysaccharide biosynthesis protein PslH
MKILWVKTDYLHPTTRGGQIRTLEMLKRLHARHEIHYLTLATGGDVEGPARASEYCHKHFAVPHTVRDKTSPLFAWDLLRGLLDPLPLAVLRWQNAELRKFASLWRSRENYDAAVCDFLAPAASLEDWRDYVLFQHNVEAQIWRRHAGHAASWPQRLYLRRQAAKMEDFERSVCRAVRRVITVSEQDARLTERNYGLESVSFVPTGVDTEFFGGGADPAAPRHDLVFLGSMDWLPNVEGARWLTREVLPLIWRVRPRTTVAFVGRNPDPSILDLRADSRLSVSGTVPDVRPWLHGASLSIVPLRIGGGTRLKIYEAMAAGVATVSTPVGAEGLDVSHGENIILAEAPDAFAQACLDLLDGESRRQRIAANAKNHVRERYGWEAVARRFEELLAP